MFYSEFPSFYSKYRASGDSTNASSSNSSHCGDSLCFTGEGEGLRWIEEKNPLSLEWKSKTKMFKNGWVELGKWEYNTEYIWMSHTYGAGVLL